MKKILFLSLAVLLFGLTANAQKIYKWESHGLSFTVPSNFSVVENTSESFQAKNNNIHLFIDLFDYQGEDPEELGQMLGQMAVDQGVEFEDVGELVLTTLEGAYLEGVLNNSNIIYMLMVDTESGVGLCASIIYADGSEQQATDICNSFAIQ